MDHTYIQLMIFKLGLLQKHITKTVNMFQTADYEISDSNPEVSEVTSQQILYQLDKLEKECANVFLDAFTYKQFQETKNAELLKEIQQELEDNGV